MTEIANSIKNFLTSSTHFSLLVILITTCVLIIYLLFVVSKFIEKILESDDKVQTITTIVSGKNEEQTVIQKINLGKTTVEFDLAKCRTLFWKGIGISYVVGIACWILPYFLIPVGVVWVTAKVLKVVKHVVV